MDARRSALIEHFTNRCSMAMGEANRLADLNIRLHDALQTQDVRFTFAKKDGTIREAYGTMRSDVIPNIRGTGRPLGFECQLFFDIERQGYRSFRKELLISIDV